MHFKKSIFHSYRVSHYLDVTEFWCLIVNSGGKNCSCDNCSMIITDEFEWLLLDFKHLTFSWLQLLKTIYANLSHLHLTLSRAGALNVSLFKNTVLTACLGASNALVLHFMRDLIGSSVCLHIPLLLLDS